MLGLRTGVIAAAFVLALAAAHITSSAVAASGSSTPTEVTFDSTITNQFAGLSNGPTGTETTQIQATIPLTASGSTYTGSAQATYAQATGTITETCTQNSMTGTTKEIEQSGNPTKFSAVYTPGSGNSGGSLQLDLGPLVGGLAESFQDIPGCGGFTVGNTTPRFLADFVANHISQLTPLLSAPGDEIFTFSLLPGASLGGSTAYAGQYNFTGGATNGNLTYDETTAISVLATASASTTTTTQQTANGSTCTVPNVKGDTLQAAKTRIRAADCSVGQVTRRKAAKAHRGKVLAESPSPGTIKPSGSKVALVVGK